jgi:DNA-binding PadR family transcriptional regulator
MRDIEFPFQGAPDLHGPRRRHHHPGPRGRGGPDVEPFLGRRRGRGRAPRGDVRSAVLLLLAEEPMHGYQLMQAIADRTDGRWRPSPGAIYPTINQLEDEGLITVTSSAGRKLAALTEAGREHVAESSGSWPDPFAASGSTEGFVDLRGELEQLHAAARQVARAGSAAQQAAAERILGDARRALYRLLADDPGPSRD